MNRIANATWKGNLKEGIGTFGVGSGAFDEQKFGFRTRFEDEPSRARELFQYGLFCTTR